MNCRDWRNLFAQEFEYFVELVPGKDDEYQPLLSASARNLKQISEYISWATMVNSGGDVCPREAALFVASCHAWDRLPRRLDVGLDYRLKYQDHMRVLARHLPAALLSIMTPPIVLCESFCERHLAVFEKKLLKRTDLAARSAHRVLPSLAAMYAGHNANIVEYLNPKNPYAGNNKFHGARYTSLMFMPCTLQTSEDIATMRWRIIEHVKGRRCATTTCDNNLMPYCVAGARSSGLSS